MILNDQDISDFVNSPLPLIDPFDQESLRGASYDLLVGTEYWLSKYDPLSGGNLSTNQLSDGQSFGIPPHAICYILCKETINLPLDIAARVTLRMSFIYKGLMLAAQPPFDQGYNGKVIVMIHNLSNHSVFLTEGERIVTMEFFRLANPASPNIKISRSVKSVLQSLKSDVTTSLQFLHKSINDTNSKVDSFTKLLGGFVTLIVAIITIINFLQYSNLNSKISDQKEIIEKQNQEIVFLRNKIENHEKLFPINHSK